MEKIKMEEARRKRGRLEQRTQLTAQLEAADEWLAVIRDYAQLEELDRPTLLRLVKRIYEGMVAGRLGPERFDRLSTQYEEEQVRQVIGELQPLIDDKASASTPTRMN